MSNPQNPHGGWPDPDGPTVATPQYQRPGPPPPAPAPGWGQPPAAQPPGVHSSWGTPAQPAQQWTPEPAPAPGWPGAPAQPGGWPAPGAAPAAPAAPTGSKGTRRKLIIAAVVVAVVAVAAVVVVPRFTGGGASSMTAAETVTAYLEALNSGDAEKALSFSKSEPANSDLLTNDILAKQIAKMPISDIRILDGSGIAESIGMGSVKVAVKFGDKLSDATVRLSKVDGIWKIEDALNKIDILSPSKADETLTIFGKKLKKGEAFYVFPGFIDVGSSNEYLDVTADSPLLSTGSVYFKPTYKLNEDGADAVGTAVTDAFAACQKSNLLDPPGCPVKINNYRAVDGTVTWGKADLSGVTTGELTEYDMTVRVTGPVTIPVSYQTRDGGTESGTAESSLFASADITTSPPTLRR